MHRLAVEPEGAAGYPTVPEIWPISTRRHGDAAHTYTNAQTDDPRWKYQSEASGRPDLSKWRVEKGGSAPLDHLEERRKARAEDRQEARSAHGKYI
jgi:hypothetical protein